MALGFETGDTLTHMKAKLRRTHNRSLTIVPWIKLFFVLPPVVDFHALKAIMLPLETKLPRSGHLGGP